MERAQRKPEYRLNIGTRQISRMRRLVIYIFTLIKCLFHRCSCLFCQISFSCLTVVAELIDGFFNNVRHFHTHTCEEPTSMR